MSDEITGVVVLQRVLLEPAFSESAKRMIVAPPWRLWFQYTRSDGIIGYSTIPMKMAGEPVPVGYVGPLWDFVQRNPFIDCSPSVRIMGPHDGAPDHFHNSGQWRNLCVIMKRPFGMDIIIDGEEVDANDMVRTINGPKTKEERDALIFRARAEGILE